MSTDAPPVSGSRPRWIETWERIWSGPPPEPGLEGSVQRVVTRLATGVERPGYGRIWHLNDHGESFFGQLAELARGLAPPDRSEWFVHEYKLPLPEQEQRPRRTALWPDYAVMWDGRLLVVELKTDSTTAIKQVIDQLRRARLKHSAELIDHVFVTVKPALGEPPLDPRMSYSNVTWEGLIPALSESFGASDEAGRLVEFIESELS